MAAVKDVVDVLPKVKAMCLADRAMFDRAMRAFVSLVQAYAKHECSLIFRVKGTRRKTEPLGSSLLEHRLCLTLGFILFFFLLFFSYRSGLCVASSGIRPPPLAQDARTEGQNLSGLRRDDGGHQLHPLLGQKPGETEAEDARRAEGQGPRSEEARPQDPRLVQTKEQEGAAEEEGGQEETQ